MWNRVALGAAATCLLFGGLTAVLASSPFNPVGWLARAVWVQASLLWGRVPLDQAAPSLSLQRRAALARIPAIKRFAEEELGLSGGGSYDSVHPTWDRVVWNVSGCAPLAFEPRRYWFPIVGSVPYMGYFDEQTAREQARRLEREGYETWVRTAGAYSTLGWFDDPVLPTMLDWPEQRLADTLIHELVHGNVWVRGSAQFNESLANFVGSRGAVAWFAHSRGVGSAEHEAAQAAFDDEERYGELIGGVVQELDGVYADPSAGDADKLARKGEILRSIPSRGESAGFGESSEYPGALRGEWNNARLLQFRTYNHGMDAFEAVWETSGSDLAAFLRRLRAVSEQAGDPWVALEAASGVDVSGM